MTYHRSAIVSHVAEVQACFCILQALVYVPVAFKFQDHLNLWPLTLEKAVTGWIHLNPIHVAKSSQSRWAPIFASAVLCQTFEFLCPFRWREATSSFPQTLQWSLRQMACPWHQIWHAHGPCEVVSTKSVYHALYHALDHALDHAMPSRCAFFNAPINSCSGLHICSVDLCTSIQFRTNTDYDIIYT